MAVFAILASWQYCSFSYAAYSMQLAVLLLAAMLFAVGTPGAPFYHPIGVLPQICGPPVASQPAAIYSVYCRMLYMQPLCSQMQPTGSQMHPHRCPISARMVPAAPYATFSAMCCICRACAAKCNHRQPHPAPRHQIAAPRQPCGQPANSHMDRILQYGPGLQTLQH